MNILTFYSVTGFIALVIFVLSFIMLTFQARKNRVLVMVPILLYCGFRCLAFLLVAVGGVTKKLSLAEGGYKFNQFLYCFMGYSFFLFIITWFNTYRGIAWGIRNTLFSSLLGLAMLVFDIMAGVGNIQYMNNPANGTGRILRVAATAQISFSGLILLQSIFLALKEFVIYQTPRAKLALLVPAILNFFRSLVFLLITQPFSKLDHEQYMIVQFAAMTMLEGSIVLVWSFTSVGKTLVFESFQSVVPITPNKIFGTYKSENDSVHSNNPGANSNLNESININNSHQLNIMPDPNASQGPYNPNYEQKVDYTPTHNQHDEQIHHSHQNQIPTQPAHPFRQNVSSQRPGMVYLNTENANTDNYQPIQFPTYAAYSDQNQESQPQPQPQPQPTNEQYQNQYQQRQSSRVPMNQMPQPGDYTQQGDQTWHQNHQGQQ